MHVDSRGLYDTISSLHNSKEYRLRQTVQRIRDSFEDGDIDVLRWIPGFFNISDEMTKRSPEMSRRINRIATKGFMDLPKHERFELESSEWL